MTDLFRELPAPNADPAATPPRPAAAPALAPADTRSPLFQRCPCGAWATLGFGLSFLTDKPGLRRCTPCARAEGLLKGPIDA